MIHIWDTIETDDTLKSYLSYQPCEFKTDYTDTEHNYLTRTHPDYTLMGIVQYRRYIFIPHQG
jgi:hypothetical protein